MPGSLYARLSGYYFFYYAAVGAFIPYWALWMQWRGFSAAQIGIAFALLGLARATVPLLWGWLADRSGRRMRMIQSASVVALALFSLLPFVPDFAWLLAVMFAYAIFWNATMPQFEVVTLNHVRGMRADYSLVRIWGSVGFVLAVVALGPLLDWLGVGPLPWLIIVLLVGMVWTSLRVPEPPPLPATDEPVQGFWRVLGTWPVVALLASSFLSQLSFAPYYGFFSIYLAEHGFDRTTIGLLWALGVAAEIWVFLHVGKLVQRFGLRALMLLAFATTAVRWVLVAAFVEVLPVLVLAQVMHLSSFGIYHACVIQLAHKLFPGRLAGRGQALLAAVSFGAGGAIGSLLAGGLWDSISGAWVYAGAAGAAALGWWIAYRGMSEHIDNKA